MMKRCGLLVVGLLVGACGCASNKVRPSAVAGESINSDAAWAAFDTNKDGYLSRDELHQQHVMALLAYRRSADRDNDGRISRAEWNAWWPKTSSTPPSPNMARYNARSAAPSGFRFW